MATFTESSKSLKTSIVLAGLLTALLLVELGLRGTGLAVTAYRSHRNAKALTTQNSLRVLCVGDSMTFNQYPPTLEKLLNKNKHGLKFTVIDRALPGTNSTDTMAGLEKNLDEYTPDIVIAMMGENDKVPGRILLDTAGTPEGGIRTLRLYRLWHYTRELLLKNRREDTTPTAPQPAASRTQPDMSREQVRKLDAISTAVLAKNDKQAEKLLLAYIPKYPRHAEARAWLGQIYNRSGRRDQAETEFQKAMQIDPDNYRILCNLSEFWLEDDAKDFQAKPLLEKAIAIEPNNHYAYFLIGSFCFNKGKLDCAESNLSRAVELKPGYQPALPLLGFVYRATGRYKDATGAMTELLKTDKNNSMAYAQLCAFYSRYERNWEKFKQTAEQALAAKLRDPYGPHECAGEAYRIFKKPDLADRLYKRAMQIAPDDPNVLATAAVFYMQEQGDAKKARLLAERALRAAPSSRRAAGLYFMMTEKHAAKEAASVPPDNRYAALTIENYREMQEILAKRKIPLVIMQYPARSLAPLKNIFTDTRGLYFADNENLKILAAKEGYAKYFYDMYAGDFGHCTAAGNEIVAANAAKAIFEQVLKLK